MNKLRIRKVNIFGQDHIANKQGPGTPTKSFQPQSIFFPLVMPQFNPVLMQVKMAAQLLFAFIFIQNGGNEPTTASLSKQCLLGETQTLQACLFQVPCNSNKMLSQGSQGAPWKLLWLLGVPTDSLSAANQEDKTVPHLKIKQRISKLLVGELCSVVVCVCVCV